MPATFGLAAGGYAVVTLHRPSNVDHAETLSALLRGLADASRRLPLVFAMHPRTRRNLDQFGLADMLQTDRIFLLPPQGYLEMLGLMSHARVVLTDSGGIQEETTALKVPCITLRENTERPITVEQGTNTLVGRDTTRMLAVLDDILGSGGKAGRAPEFWDGHAAERIADHLCDWLIARCAV
jgi:UDP-N-acetylglucosamine 2-epimerase (non-hydrolysing)